MIVIYTHQITPIIYVHRNTHFEKNTLKLLTHKHTHTHTSPIPPVPNY